MSLNIKIFIHLIRHIDKVPNIYRGKIIFLLLNMYLSHPEKSKIPKLIKITEIMTSYRMKK